MPYRTLARFSLSTIAAALLLCCLADARTPAADSPPTGQDALAPPEAPPLTCTIRSEPTCELGNVPTISVEIANWTDDEIYLVGSLDNSDRRWRYPFCYFEVIGPDGKRAKPGIARCGNINAIREKDFVKVPPVGKFDPYQKIDEYGFFGSSLITPETFHAEGQYRVRFVYSTAAADPKFWLGDAQGEMSRVLRPGNADDSAITKLLKRVPKTTVCSNEITITVVAAAKSANGVNSVPRVFETE